MWLGLAVKLGGILLAVLLLITYIPSLTLFVPQLFYPAK